MQRPWQKDLQSSFTSMQDLLNFLEFDKKNISITTNKFPLLVPLSFAKRIEKNNPLDPLFQQVSINSEENNINNGFSNDPLEEINSIKIPGLIHKYKNRVLLTVAGSCSINCRYCFRREFPYSDNNIGKNNWNTWVDYIQKDLNIREVILSGGEPLMLKDDLLEELCAMLAKINHIHTLRIHTRMPIALPSRVDNGFINSLSKINLKKIMVLHSNHAQEWNNEVKHACDLLKDAGFKLLNQSVLLKNINDNANTLAQLSETLFFADVMPYYLHILDKVHGSAHFDLPIKEVQKIYSELQKLLPGYLVPKLVQELPNMEHKKLIIC